MKFIVAATLSLIIATNALAKKKKYNSKEDKIGRETNAAHKLTQNGSLGLSETV